MPDPTGKGSALPFPGDGRGPRWGAQRPSSGPMGRTVPRGQSMGRGKPLGHLPPGSTSSRLGSGCVYTPLGGAHCQIGQVGAVGKHRLACFFLDSFFYNRLLFPFCAESPLHHGLDRPRPRRRSASGRPLRA
ncbi:unnamed protein product [Musa textilis]